MPRHFAHTISGRFFHFYCLTFASTLVQHILDTFYTSSSLKKGKKDERSGIRTHAGFPTRNLVKLGFKLYA